MVTETAMFRLQKVTLGAFPQAQINGRAPTSESNMVEG